MEGGITHSQASYQALMNFLPIAAGGMIGEGGMYDRGGVELRGPKSGPASARLEANSAVAATVSAFNEFHFISAVLSLAQWLRLHALLLHLMRRVCYSRYTNTHHIKGKTIQ